jgi:cephalosporin hydroxylase
MNIFKKKKKVKTISNHLAGLERGHQKITYKSVPCIKCPFDYVMYQMIINEIKPDLLIEIGTNHGGSALYMADIMDSIGKGKIHTIDIDDRSYTEAKAHSRISFFHEGWENYDMDLTKGFQKIMVIEDASHEYKNTLQAIERFAPVVTKDSYLIVEDGIIDALGWTEDYNGGPVKAIKEFLPKHPEFQIDYKWINMFGENATFNTLGYLLKTNDKYIVDGK